MVHHTDLLTLSTPGTLTNNIPAIVTSNMSQNSQELPYPTNINNDLL